MYTYCENDGVNAWDPSGHYKIKMKHINGMKWKKNWKGRKWTKKNISMMNALLKKYGIKKKKSIALMMATCDQESGQGRIMQEEEMIIIVGVMDIQYILKVQDISKLQEMINLIFCHI